MKRFARARISLMGSVAVLTGLPAHAEEVKSPDTGMVIEQVVVTAQKRTEFVQDVPIAITAISAATLSNKRLTNTIDLSFATPALQYSDAGGFAQPFLRGIGTDFTQANADSSVATYVDGAYVANDQGAVFNLLGVSRVEVLEGPQGTLYGRNAVGGAINVITLTPDETPEASVSVTGGNYSRREMSGYASGPVADDLYVGIYAGGIWRDPYVDIRNSPNLSSQSTNLTVQTDSDWGVRGKAVYEPSDHLRFTLSLEQIESQSLEYAAYRQVAPNSAAVNLFGAPFVDTPYLVSTDQGAFVKARSQSATLKEEVGLGWAQLVGISNGRKLRTSSQVDVDASSAAILSSALVADNSEQFSQELQLVSPEGQALKWVGGLYYYHESSGFFPINIASDVLFPPPLNGTSQFVSVLTEGYAAFAQADIPLDFVTDNLSLTLGSRYSIDKKHFKGTQISYATGSLHDCGDNAYFLSPACGTILSTDQYDPASHTWYQFMPKVTLDYKIDNTLLYFTWSKGYQSGLFNISGSLTTSKVPIKPEKLTDFEIGSKSTLADGRLVLNMSGYYYILDDIQVQIVTASGQLAIQNAGDNSKAYGFEASADYLITEDLTASAGLSLEHTAYGNFPNYAGTDLSQPCSGAADCNPAATFDVSGKQFQRAPSVVWTLGLDYTHRMSNGGSVHANVDWYHNGGFNWTAQGSEAGGIVQRSYSLVNMSAGYTFPNGEWTVKGWVTNLTDTFRESQVVPISFFGAVAADAAPRMFGATVTYDMK